jgi:TolB-like protein
MGIDEEGTLRALKEHRQAVLDPQIAAHRGRIVKTTGDGLLVEFASVVDAVDCACAIQREMAERNTSVLPDRRLEFRVGINLGDIIIDSGDIFGDGVNIAARLEALAAPGGICVSRVVHDELNDKRALEFQDLGEHTVKNIARPLRVFGLASSGENAMTAATRAGSVAARTDPRHGIAVLPFTNMSGDPEQEYFTDGMVEDIITALSRFKEFFVIARNSSFVYKGRAVDIQQVARELGVHYVLEGSVRKAGNRLRITGQLIDAETRAHLWANRFDGALEDVFDLQDRITESVVGALAPMLRQAEIERALRKPVANLDAYDYLLRALPLVLANTVAEAPESIRLLTEALRLHPDYARAHAFISMSYAQMFRSAVGPEREPTRLKAVEHARKALALAGEDSTALAHAGFVLIVTAKDVATARNALDRAVTLNPNQATARGYRALVLSMAGDAEAAIEDGHRALRLSPIDPAAYQSQMALVIAHIWLGQFDEAVAWAQKAIAGAPPRYPMSYAWLIVAECGRGGKAEAERQLQRLAGVLPAFGPDTLFKLFDIFPEPLRSKSLTILRDAGLVSGENA